MNRKSVLAVIVVALVAGTAILLAAVPQRLGAPGVKASPIPGSERWQVYLPEHILDFDSTNREPDAGTVEMLPKDTSFAERVYFKPGIIPFVSSVVLMGSDRTSIHKAQYCLTGQGMHIDQMTRDTVHVDQPEPYDLPIIKIFATEPSTLAGDSVTRRCVYVYWYVADGKLSNDPSGVGRMWSMAKQLMFTGVLQRWAYVRFYTICKPGQEDAAYAEIKKMIAASVPQFQLAPRASQTTVSALR